jgi:hypothetical protein
MNSILKISTEGAEAWADNLTGDWGRNTGMNAAPNPAMIHDKWILEDLEKPQKS